MSGAFDPNTMPRPCRPIQTSIFPSRQSQPPTVRARTDQPDLAWRQWSCSHLRWRAERRVGARLFADPSRRQRSSQRGHPRHEVSMPWTLMRTDVYPGIHAHAAMRCESESLLGGLTERPGTWAWCAHAGQCRRTAMSRAGAMPPQPPGSSQDARCGPGTGLLSRSSYQEPCWNLYACCVRGFEAPNCTAFPAACAAACCLSSSVPGVA